MVRHPLPTPTRRIVLIGASNVVRSFATVVETCRLVWGEPLEIMAAIGHGRSFGQDSWVCGRKISGIFPCALWDQLQRRPPLPTAALVTDVGNDLAYGVEPDRLLAWVEACLDRLDEAGATTVLTELPIRSIAAVEPWRFRLLRTLLFPSCSLPLEELQRRAREVNRRLVELGSRRKIPVISVSDAWYGFDPIHLRRSVRRRAWPEILSAWRDELPGGVTPRVSFWQWAYLACLAPEERMIFGWRRRSEQPCGVLNDGTTISLY